MKAAIVEDYGTPDIIKIKDIDRPELKADELLLKVYASSVNTTDTAERKKPGFTIQLVALLLRWKMTRRADTGSDVAGEIVSIGSDIAKFKVGDQVYGLSRTGSCAEYAKTSEKSIALKPKTMTYLEAAAVPIIGLTALQYLRDLGNIRDGQEILVYGASGGVGTYAVQYAKTFNVRSQQFVVVKMRNWLKTLELIMLLIIPKKILLN